MDEQYYGAPSSSDVKPLRERLREYYGETDFVTVINIDTKPLKYQFMPPDGQQFVQSGAWNGETYNIKPPQVVILQPGGTKLCPAYEADLMIENLIKQVVAGGVENKIRLGQLRPDAIADWTDPVTQKNLINKIFLGKQDLIGQFNQTVNDAKQPEVKESNDSTGQPARIGRPPKAATGA